MKWLRATAASPSAVLFAVQMLGIAVYPAMEGSTAGRTVFNLFGVAVALLALWTVRSSPGLTWVAVLLVLPTVLLLPAQSIRDAPQLAGWSSVFEAALYFYAAVCMLMYMLADHVITLDELWAVGATFTLLAWAFAHVYVVVQAIVPRSFGAAVDAEQARTWVELLFLSVTTLTSTGLSDIVPLTPAARAAVMFEQIIGLGYTVMLVSRVVGLTFNRRS